VTNFLGRAEVALAIVLWRAKLDEHTQNAERPFSLATIRDVGVVSP